MVVGPLLWAALRVRTDHRGAARQPGGGPRSPQAPPRAGDWTGTRVSQLQVRGLKSEGRLWEMQTVGRKGRQELSSEGRWVSSEDWRGRQEQSWRVAALQGPRGGRGGCREGTGSQAVFCWLVGPVGGAC